MGRLFGVINVVFALGVMVWPMLVGLVLFFGIFLFDAPGSEHNTLLKAFLISLLVYPIPVVVGSVLYWRTMTRSSTVQKMLYTAIGSFGYVAIGVLFLLFQMICFGRTSCTPPTPTRVYSQPPECLEIEPVERRVGDFQVIRGNKVIVNRTTRSTPLNQYQSKVETFDAAIPSSTVHP